MFIRLHSQYESRMDIMWKYAVSIGSIAVALIVAYSRFVCYSCCNLQHLVKLSCRRGSMKMAYLLISGATIISVVFSLPCENNES